MQNQIQKSVLKKASAKKKANALVFSLNLTALIDAFSILVIFLLTNMNNGFQNIDLKNGMVLPKASQGDAMESGVVVKVANGKFQIENETLDNNQLLSRFLTLKKQAVIIQADQKENFEQISIILKAAAQAGIEKYMLAILPTRSASQL